VEKVPYDITAIMKPEMDADSDDSTAKSKIILPAHEPINATIRDTLPNLIKFSIKTS
jgi:hypothetical protein